MTLTERFATLFGIGRMPIAPGTAASLAAALAAWPISRAAGPMALFAAAMAASLIAIVVSDAYVKESGREDPSECVIDELAGQWVACAFAPLSLGGYAAAFVLFRLFDMAKPWPVSAAEKLDGGYGVVADDLAAGLIAGTIVLLFDQSGLL